MTKAGMRYCVWLCKGEYMASIVSEYQRFLDCLTQQDVSDDVRRLAYLIFDHIQPLAEVGSTRRARSVRLAP